MDKLTRIGVGNTPPLPQNTKLVLADDYNKVVDKVNEIITTDAARPDIQLSTTPPDSVYSIGRIFYDSTNKTVATDLENGVTLQLGMEELERYENVSGETIYNGEAVYIFGANGSLATCKKARANTYTTATVAGIAAQDILDGDVGYVCCRGQIHDIDTTGVNEGETWNEGDRLYLSPIIAGKLSNLNPGTTIGYFDVAVAYVIKKHATAGIICVEIVPNRKLGDLSNVNIDTPITDQVLKYNGTSWINGNGSNVSAGAGVTLFFSDTASGISTYETISTTPDSSVEVDESISVNNETKDFEAYSTVTALGRTVIDAGIWNFGTYSYVNTNAGVSNLLMDVYKRTSIGEETLLFTCTSDDINNTTVSLIECSSVQPAFVLNATDLLVVKVRAKTTNTSETIIHFVHSGTVNYSHIHTPLITKHDDLAGIKGGEEGQRNHLTNAQVTIVNNQSNVNTGDETESTIKTKLGITVLTGDNTGDQNLTGLVPKTTTVNSKALSGNITLDKTDIGLSNVPNLAFSGSNTGDETTTTIKTKLGAASLGADGYLTSTDFTAFNSKQAALVSATNIKTINSTSVLGSGDIAVQPTINGTGFVKASGTTISFDNSTYSTAVKATGTEINTGTDDAKFVTAKALKDSTNVPDVAPGNNLNLLMSNGTNWISSPHYTAVKTLVLDTSTGANTTPVSLTDLLWTYEANAIYFFSWRGGVITANNTTGCGFQLDVSTAVTEIEMGFYHQLANSGTVTGGSSTADNTSLGVSSGVPTNSTVVPVIGHGMLRTDASTGTAQLRFRSEVNVIITAKAGLTLLVERIA